MATVSDDIAVMKRVNEWISQPLPFICNFSFQNGTQNENKSHCCNKTGSANVWQFHYQIYFNGNKKNIQPNVIQLLHCKSVSYIIRNASNEHWIDAPEHFQTEYQVLAGERYGQKVMWGYSSIRSILNECDSNRK